MIIKDFLDHIAQVLHLVNIIFILYYCLKFHNKNYRRLGLVEFTFKENQVWVHHGKVKNNKTKKKNEA